MQLSQWVPGNKSLLHNCYHDIQCHFHLLWNQRGANSAGTHRNCFERQFCSRYYSQPSRSAFTFCAAAAPAASITAHPKQSRLFCLSAFPGEFQIGNVSGHPCSQKAAFAYTAAPVPSPDQGGEISVCQGYTLVCIQTLYISLK